MRPSTECPKPVQKDYNVEIYERLPLQQIVRLRRRKKRHICQVTTQGYLKEYKLTVDASDVGVGALLLQEGKDDIDLPNCYLFLKGLTTIRTNNPQLIKTAF
jgi:hypothetical protein